MMESQALAGDYPGNDPIVNEGSREVASQGGKGVISLQRQCKDTSDHENARMNKTHKWQEVGKDQSPIGIKKNAHEGKRGK